MAIATSIKQARQWAERDAKNFFAKTNNGSNNNTGNREKVVNWNDYLVPDTCLAIDTRISLYGDLFLGR